MGKIEIRNLYKDYIPGIHAVTNFSLTIENGEFIVLVGPSGCGKSTTLRMIAGLEDITAGELLIDGEMVNDVHPKDRNIAMVFQNYALYPHMDVAENMGFGLSMKKIPQQEIDTRVKETAKIIDLEDYLDRLPKELSGGQRQRVALGRAIARKPQVFLMDEPLSNLDAKLRVHTRSQISSLARSLKTTTIYVTHDQVEAMTMADRIVVMDKGFIQQVGTPKEIYLRPENKFVASFIGSPAMNFTTVKMGTYGIERYGHVMDIPAYIKDFFLINGFEDKEVIMGIRPENIYLDGQGPRDLTAYGYSTHVNVCEILGAETLIHYDMLGDDFVSREFGFHEFKPGDPIRINFDFDFVHFFDVETGRRFNIPGAPDHFKKGSDQAVEVD